MPGLWDAGVGSSVSFILFLPVWCCVCIDVIGYRADRDIELEMMIEWPPLQAGNSR